MFANRKTRHLMLAAAAAVALLALVGGCAQQDLYEPPGSPYEIVGSLALPSVNEGVDVSGDYAFVAGGEAGLHAVDISNPREPVLVATVNTTKYADDIEVVQAFDGGVLRDIAHLVEGTEGVTSFDVTDPHAIIDYETGTTAIVGRTIAIAPSNDPDVPYTVYLADDWKGVQVMPAISGNPGILDRDVFIETNGKAYGIAIKGGWAYVADNEMGICVIDINNPQFGEAVAWADTPGDARAIAVEGDHAFVADGVEGLAVFHIDGASTPERVAQYDLSGFSEAIVVRDGLCAIAANGGGVHFLDVSEPTEPIYLGSQATSYATGVDFSDDGYCVVVDEDDGLLVLGGRGPFGDNTPPAPIRDLAVEALSVSTLELSWTMTGDDGYSGTASSVEFRWSDAPIRSVDEWDDATPVPDAPEPAAPGVKMTMTVPELDRNRSYYFAAQVTDDEGFVSLISNSAEGTTLDQIVLRNGSVSPLAGSSATTFTYSVEVRWGLPITSASVLIDGVAHPMTPGEGRFYVFAIEGLLAGEHEYSFLFVADTSPDAVFPSDHSQAAGPVVSNTVFTMGSPESELGRSDDEPLHEVALATELIASPHEVKQSEWEEVMDPDEFPNPSQHLGANRPVDTVSWLAALEYCNARSVADGYDPVYDTSGGIFGVSWDRTANGWRLPTEAEWEYLCRADGSSALHNGAELTELNCRFDEALDEIAWYCGNAPSGPAEVGQKEANSLGLYDMSGNLREWCWDWYGELSSDAVFDSGGPETGERKVCRGGSWFVTAQECRSAARGKLPPDSADDTVGFRVVRNAFGG